MAQVSKATWDAFIKVNDLYDAGKLKDQKFTTTDVVKGTLALKQWYMKPLLSLPDEAKLCLLNKVKNRFFFRESSLSCLSSIWPIDSHYQLFVAVQNI